jgi:hypothetical protein
MNYHFVTKTLISLVKAVKINGQPYCSRYYSRLTAPCTILFTDLTTLTDRNEVLVTKWWFIKSNVKLIVHEKNRNYVVVHGENG